MVNLEKKSCLNRKMLSYTIQKYFIFVLSLIHLANTNFSQGTTIQPPNCKSSLHNCSCSNNNWQKETIVVTCNKMTNVTDFFGQLDSDDTLQGYNTYYLTLNDIKHLPAGAFSGRKIVDLNLDGIDATVDDDVFDEITNLKKFVVRTSSIEKIPDFRYASDSIEIVLIFSSRLTALEGEHLQNLPHLVHLSVFNNSISFIHPDVFLGTESLTTLDLSYNLLTTIPPDLLQPMKKLHSFHASHNNLLQLNNLFATTHPKEIFLDFNNITDVDSLLKFQLDNASTLVLSNNPIKKISKDSFNGKINNIVNLHLQNCQLRELNVQHYEHLSKLKVLDLSYNLLEDVSKISSEVAPFENGLTTLMLTGNKLQCLSFMQICTQVVNLGAGGNQIKYLTDEDFKSVQNMEFLELHNNEIEQMDSSTFQPLKNDLQRLDLSSNFITSLNGSIKHLSKLKVLNITQNLIQSFAKDEFTGLTSLTKLYIQYNQLKVLGHLRKVLSLQYLDVAHNDIETIALDQVPKYLEFVNLADNSIKCDCRIQPFALEVTESTTLETDVNLCLKSDPSNGLHKTLCPSTCSCYCTKDGDESFMFANCSSKHLCDLPQFSNDEASTVDTSLERRRFVMDQTVYPSLHIQDRVLGINLENNNLESLNTAQIAPDLIQLYLANNKLRKLPEFVFDNLRNLKKVSLSRNPWDCDCSTMKFKKWLLTNNAIIQDFTSVRCGTGNNADSSLDGRVIYSLSDHDICKSNKQLIYYIFIGILTVIVLSLLMKIIYTKHQFKIKKFLNCIGLRKKSYNDEKNSVALFFHNIDNILVK